MGRLRRRQLCLRLPLLAAGILAGRTFAMQTAPRGEPSRIVEADNALGFRLLQRMHRTSGGNLLISPSSIAAALQMAWNGAGGDTRDEMSRALGLSGIPESEVNQANADLLRAARGQDSRVQLAIANAIWARTGERFAPAFERVIREHYDGRAESLDFSKPAAVQTINRWVAERTGGMIRDLLSPRDVAQSAAILTNAVYFKGIWATQFDPKQTKPGTFTLASGQPKPIPLMHLQIRMGYLKGEGFQGIELPYGDGRFRMDVLLPDSPAGLDPLLTTLSAERWEEWTKGLRGTEVALAIPRFRMSTKEELKQPLEALGMRSAFGPGADFGPMGLTGAWIGQVKHAAEMEVDEKGTKAAAATAVTMTRGVRRVITVTVDHPFLCAVRDTRSGAILFLGAVADPQPI